MILQCQSELRRLLQGSLAIAGWFDPDSTPPAFDVHSPLLSLPLVFRTTLQSIPRNVPYLRADPGAARRWRDQVSGCSNGSRASKGLKVGLAWAGRASHRNDHNRSLPLSALAPLTQVRGVTFYSLQKGEASQHAANPPPGLELIDFSPQLDDFAETAALIANLDLIISVDTAVVHLAGAMGTSVWTLLPFVPDWRWLLNRLDSPWYPTLQLFRQPSLGDWASVISLVVRTLSNRIENRHGPV